MSTLTLVRHGQAHAFDEDSDRLTETGELQARLLGEYWRARDVVFDTVITGALRRHRQTAEAAGFTDCVVDAGWNEYDASGILRAFGGGGFQPSTAEDRNRAFQRMFEPLMEDWRLGRLADASVEPFVQYEARVLEAFAKAKLGSSRNVLVFTSGGPIGLCVQHTLNAPSRTFLELNWRVRNCSITEFTFSSSSGRCSLDSFNGLPHLDTRDPALRTWR